MDTANPGKFCQWVWDFLELQESGFSFIEFNASDSRSKKTLEEQVSEVLGNKAIDGYLLSGGTVNINTLFTKFDKFGVTYWNRVN